MTSSMLSMCQNIQVTAAIMKVQHYESQDDRCISDYEYGLDKSNSNA